MDSPIIADAIEFVKDLFASDFSGHDLHHTLRVCRMAERLAEAEHADRETVLLAALLHDADDRKLSPQTYERKDNARRFLREHSVPEERIEAIVHIIGQVSFAGTDSVVPDTVEGKCVQDADRLDAIGAIGIARAFAYGGSRSRSIWAPDIAPRMNMTAEEFRTNYSSTVNHFYEKLLLLKDMMNTPSARAIAEERDVYMRAFLTEFFAEWDGRK